MLLYAGAAPALLQTPASEVTASRDAELVPTIALKQQFVFSAKHHNRHTDVAPGNLSYVSAVNR
jgi:hypothetical protein